MGVGEKLPTKCYLNNLMIHFTFAMLIFFSSLEFFPTIAPTFLISQAEAERIADLMWENECGRTIEGLTTWNAGEEFASFGLAHFIWYPEGAKGPFYEQFPEFLSFAKQKDVPIPEWLKTAQECPWNSKEEFRQQFYSTKMIELRQFLHATLALQACFIAHKLENVLPKMTLGLPKEDEGHVIKMFYWVRNDPHGIYPLADYLNFKGDGTSIKERYCGKGWGLLQVLERMRETSPLSPIEEFVLQAKAVLAERVKHAPKARREEKWLIGWYNRLDTYLKI